MKRIYVLAATLFLSSVLALPARAEQPPATTETNPLPDVFISEINWAGSALSTADEWIELFNATSTRVDLGGWILTGAATSGNALAIEDGFSIEANSTALISNYSLGNEKSTLDAEPDLVTSSLSLPNSDLHIMLTTPDGVVVDEVLPEDQVGSSKDQFISMERIDDVWVAATDSVSLTDSAQLGTPGVYNVEDVESVPDAENIDNTSSDLLDSSSSNGDPVEATTEPASPSDQEMTNQSSEDDAVDADIETEDDSVPEAGDAVETTETETDLDTTTPETDIEESIVLEDPTEESSDADVITPADEPEASETTEEVDSASSDDEESAEPSETNSNNDSVNTSETQPTPTAANTNTQSVTNVVATPATVTYNIGILRLNEVVSDPADGTEWVEILNTGSTTIHLLGWGLMDASGKLTAFPDDTIEPNGFYIVEDPAGNLNNSGDSVYLYDPNGIVIDEMSYGIKDVPAPKKNQSLIFQDGSWVISDVITKESENPEPTPIALIEPIQTEPYEDQATESVATDDQKTQSKTAATNEQVSQDDSELSDSDTVHKVVAIANSVETTKTSSKLSSSKSTATKEESSTTSMTGVVTALPGTFGDQVAFMQGTEIYSYYQDWPLLALGDIVTVTGETSENRGEERLKTGAAADIVVVQHGTLTATHSDIASLATLVPGTLVEIHGTIRERGSNNFTLEDETGTITVSIHENTGITLSNLPSGEITVTGVLRKFGDTFKVYPRMQSDIIADEKTVTTTAGTIEPTSVLPRKKSTSPLVGAGLVAAAVGMVTYWYIAKNGIKLGVHRKAAGAAA